MKVPLSTIIVPLLVTVPEVEVRVGSAPKDIEHPLERVKGLPGGLPVAAFPESLVIMIFVKGLPEQVKVEPWYQPPSLKVTVRPDGNVPLAISRLK